MNAISPSVGVSPYVYSALPDGGESQTTINPTTPVQLASTPEKTTIKPAQLNVSDITSEAFHGAKPDSWDPNVKQTFGKTAEFFKSRFGARESITFGGRADYIISLNNTQKAGAQFVDALQGMPDLYNTMADHTYKPDQSAVLRYAIKQGVGPEFIKGALARTKELEARAANNAKGSELLQVLNGIQEVLWAASPVVGAVGGKIARNRSNTSGTSNTPSSPGGSGRQPRVSNNIVPLKRGRQPVTSNSSGGATRVTTRGNGGGPATQTAPSTAARNRSLSDKLRSREKKPNLTPLKLPNKIDPKTINVALKAVGTQPGPEWQKLVGKNWLFQNNPITKATVEKAATQQLNKMEERPSPPVSRSCQLRSSASAVTNPPGTEITQTNTVTVRATVNAIVSDGRGGTTSAETNDSQATTYAEYKRRRVDETVKHIFQIKPSAIKGRTFSNLNYIFIPAQVVAPTKVTTALKYGQPTTIRSVTTEKPESKETLLNGSVRVEVESTGISDNQSEFETVNITPEKLVGGTSAITNRISQTENSGGCIYVDNKTGIPYKVKATPVLKPVGSSAATNPKTHMDVIRNPTSGVLRSTQGLAPNRPGAVPIAEGQSSKFGRP